MPRHEVLRVVLRDDEKCGVKINFKVYDLGLTDGINTSERIWISSQIGLG
jgi:hypothetical protein